MGDHDSNVEVSGANDEFEEHLPFGVLFGWNNYWLKEKSLLHNLLLSHKKHDPNDLPSYVMMVKIISSFLKWLK
jgi:hypothetical protein